MKPFVIAAGLLLAGSLAACSNEADRRAVDRDTSESPSPTVASPTAVPAAEGSVRTRGPVMVLDDGDGAELCLAGVAESYPPQCGGPQLVGWDWGVHEHERAHGVRWGEFGVVGTFDGASFTPTEVMPAADYEPVPGPDQSSLATPCEAPEGGWQVVDAAKVTPEALDATFQVADRLPHLGLAWMDQSPFGDQAQPDDLAAVVINVAVTQDKAGAEERLREVWGGALCVSDAEHSQRELEEMSRGLAEFPGFLSGGGATGPDRLELTVIHDDGSLQAWADQTYGDGVVKVTSALVSAED